MASIVGDFERHLSSLTLRPFDDGRFIVSVDGRRVFDMDRTGRFPEYEEEIKPRLAARADGS